MAAQAATYDVRWDAISGCYRSYRSEIHDAQPGPQADCVHRHRDVTTAATCAVRRENKAAAALLRST